MVKDTKKILLISDLAGYGKVALSVMFPILSEMGYELLNLPTALVSNTLDYGKFHILDTTDYIRHTIEIWEDLGFDFDAICTGFLTSEEQTRLIGNYCMEKKAQGIPLFVDPIMGDNGNLYNGVTENTVTYMQMMCRNADLIMPNMTEACFLAGKFAGRESLSNEEALELMESLLGLTEGSIVVTSASVEGKMENLVFAREQRELFHLPYEEIPVRFPGTGDIFSSVLIGNYLKEKNLKDSVEKAMELIQRLIQLNRENGDKYKGIPIERYLSCLHR